MKADRHNGNGEFPYSAPLSVLTLLIALALVKFGPAIAPFHFVQH